MKQSQGTLGAYTGNYGSNIGGVFNADMHIVLIWFRDKHVIP